MLLDSCSQRQWPSKQRMLAIILILVGTVLAVGIIENDIAQLDGIGLLCAACSALTYSLFLWLAGKWAQEVDAVTQSAIMITAGFVYVFLLYLPYQWPMEHTGTLLSWVMWLSLLGQILPTLLFNFGIAKIGSSLAAIIGAMELPVAVFGSWFILAEKITALNIVGISCIMIGIVVSEFTTNRKLQGELEN